MSATQTLNQDLDIILVVEDEPTLPVRTRLTFAAQDPLAVTMTFMTADKGVRWTFARDLLWEGMSHAAGEGDVRVFPDGDSVRLVLHAPSGRAEFLIDPFDLAVFLDETHDVVPRGQEHLVLDVDSAIARLLDAA
jgi:hypothetical protein